MSRPLISLDLETTGLDIQRHEAWEVGLAAANDAALEKFASWRRGTTWLGWEFPVRDLAAAEAGALQVNDYYQRAKVHPNGTLARRLHEPERSLAAEKAPGNAALEIARYLDGACLMGCAVQFDMRFLEKLLLDYGVRPSWHHRGLDLGSYSAGIRGAAYPDSSGSMAEVIPNDEAHTAVGDALWNVKVFESLQQSAQRLQGKQ